MVVLIVLCFGVEMLCCLHLMYSAYDTLPGPSCSKLTTSLVNVLLKFQTLIFVTLADICLTNLCLNDIVKLTMLLTTGS